MAGRRMNYGKRFRGHSITKMDLPSIGYLLSTPISLKLDPSKRQPRSLKSKIEGMQQASLTSHKKKGIMPSLPTFSFDSQIDPRTRCLLAAAACLQGGKADSIVLEQGGSALVAVNVGRKQRFVWVEIATGKVEGIEP